MNLLGVAGGKRGSWQREAKGKHWDICNRTINKIYLKNKTNL